jgi:hypothetical protein
MTHRWRKSSHSGQGPNCVELGVDRIRDSKNPDGPTLYVDVAVLVAEIKKGRFATSGPACS